MDKRWETAAYIDQGALDLVHKLKEGSHHTVCDSSGRNTESTADERDHLACLERQSKTYSRNDGEARPPQFSTVHISLQSSQAGNAWLKVFHSLKKIMVLDVFLNMRLDLRIAFAYILGQRPYSFRNKTACYDAPVDTPVNIIHYKINWKPWHYRGVRFEDDFWYYAEMTPYADMLYAMRDSYSAAQSANDQLQYENLVAQALSDTAKARSGILV